MRAPLCPTYVGTTKSYTSTLKLYLIFSLTRGEDLVAEVSYVNAKHKIAAEYS